MVDRARVVELAPHYVANVVLIFAVIAALRFTVGDQGLLVELGVVVAVVLLYPTVVRWLGVEPSIWEK